MVATIDVGGFLGGMTAGKDTVWVTDGTDGRLVRIEPSTGDVAEVIDIEGTPFAVATTGDVVWVADADEAVLTRGWNLRSTRPPKVDDDRLTGT